MSIVGGGTEVERIARYEARAAAEMKSADKALAQFMIANAPHLKFHDAIEHFQRAARAYIVAGEWQDSAEAFAKASDTCAHVGMTHEAAVFAVKAGDEMRKIDPDLAVTHYRNAVSLFCELGRFFTAGNIQKEVAEMLEADKNYDDACEYYRQASDYFLGDAYEEEANQCLVKVASLAALCERWDFATETFERVATYQVDYNLLRLNVKDLLFRAGLCQLANGGPLRKGLASHSVLRFYLSKWVRLDYSFSYSREYLFLTNLLEIIPKADLEAFAEHAYNMDNVVGFDQWQLRVLNRVREDIQGELDRIERKKKKEAAEEQRKKDLEEGLIRPDMSA